MEISLTLRELAQAYHDRCELYDRTVCTGPMGRDGIRPSDAREIAIISRYARQVLTDLSNESGFSVEELRKAIRYIK